MPAAVARVFPLADRRRNLHTSILLDRDATRPDRPPPGVFDLVQYRAPLGMNFAYVSPVVAGKKRPAIVWVAGGFDWGIGESSWERAPRSNDQTARAFREAGVVLMRPSLRGSSGNPGKNECFLGEVDDVIAAGAYLATRADVDPSRVYLGGHSTGGTLALLVAASTDRFRAVFAFGPVADASSYGSMGCVPDGASEEEAALRAPVDFLADVVTPTWVIEGQETPGNVAALGTLGEHVGHAPVRFVVVPGANHFSVLAPGTEVVARAILGAAGAAPEIRIAPPAIAAGVAASEP